jgi:hypothetical protein
MGLLKATKKVYFIPQKRKKNKDTYGNYPTKFACSTQKHKKVIEPPNKPIEIKNSQIKVCLVYFKSEKKAKIRMGAT